MTNKSTIHRWIWIFSRILKTYTIWKQTTDKTLKPTRREVLLGIILLVCNTGNQFKHLQVKRVSVPCSHLCAGTRRWWTWTSSLPPPQRELVYPGSGPLAQVSLSMERQQRDEDQSSLLSLNSSVSFQLNNKHVQHSSAGGICTSQTHFLW